MENEKTNGYFRKRIVPFTQVSNSALRDAQLSLKAKGLYALIQSYITIPDFNLNKAHLKSLCLEKEKAFDSSWKELKNKGYLKQIRSPQGTNNSFIYEYDLLEEADLTVDALINLNSKGEIIENKTKDFIKEKEEFFHTPQKGGSGEIEKISTSHTPLFVPYAKRTTCETYHIQKGGYINNTDINNTNISNTSNQVKSYQVIIENKETIDEQTGQDKINNTNMEIKNLKNDKEILELKQQISELKKNDENIIHTSDLKKYEFYKELIKNNIDYDWIYNNFKTIEKPKKEDKNFFENYNVFREKQDFLKLTDIFLDIMAETMASNKKTIKINKEEIGQSLVSKKFEMFTQSQLFFAVQQYKEYAKRTTVKFPKQYILTCIYNSTTETVAAEFTNKL